MTFLVTGGGGFLGRHIVGELLAKDHRVRILARGDYPDLAARGVECRRADIRDAEAVAAACVGCDGVFHVAGVAGFCGPREKFFGINVRGTANVLHGCVLAKVPRLVYTSSPSVVYDVRTFNVENGDESLPYPDRFVAAYPESKARAEKMVLEWNGWEMVVENPDGTSAIERLATCALRPHLVWGAGDRHLAPRIIEQARRGKLRIVGDGKNRVSMAHVRDVAAAHVQAMDALTPDSPLAGEAYFINDDKPVLMWEWVNQLLSGIGVPPVTRRIPYRLGWLYGACLESVCELFPRLGEPRLTRFVAAQMAGCHWFNCAKARRDFGFSPSVPHDRGMAELIAFLQSQ